MRKVTVSHSLRPEVVIFEMEHIDETVHGNVYYEKRDTLLFRFQFCSFVPIYPGRVSSLGFVFRLILREMKTAVTSGNRAKYHRGILSPKISA